MSVANFWLFGLGLPDLDRVALGTLFSMLGLVFEGVGCVDAAVVNGGCDRTGASGMGNGE